MFNRNTSKIMAVGFALVVLLSGFSIALAGGAAAQTDSTVLVDDSFTPTNSTQSAYVDITGANSTVFNGSGPVAVDVTYEGLNESETAGNGTVLKTETVDVTAGNVTSSEYTLADSDATTYDSIHVTVDVVTDGEEDLIESVDWGTLEQLSGGGGGLLSGSVGGVPVLAVIVVVGAYFVLGRD
jgi:ABC-type oligopeptide transport system substrate-binding subunit